MAERNELTTSDQKLLEEIELIITNDKDARRENHSLFGFCAHLASTVPIADSDFRHRLQEHIVATWKRPKDVQTEAVSPGENPGAGFALKLQLLVPHASRISRFFQKRGGLTMKKSFVLVTLAAFIITSLTVAFVPSVQAAVIDAIRRIVLGPNTDAIQIEVQDEYEPRPIPPDMWIIRTEIGNFGGNAPHGVDPIVHSINSFEEAQTLTNFHLRTPTILPEGYDLREVKLAPIGATTWAIMFYTGPGREIIIAQMPGGPQPSDDPNVFAKVMSGIITDGTMEELDFDGHPAVWIEDKSLLWEEGGVSYQLGGLDLGLDQAMEMARSLQ